MSVKHVVGLGLSACRRVCQLDIFSGKSTSYASKHMIQWIVPPYLTKCRIRSTERTKIKETSSFTREKRELNESMRLPEIKHILATAVLHDINYMIQLNNTPPTNFELTTVQRR